VFAYQYYIARTKKLAKTMNNKEPNKEQRQQTTFIDLRLVEKVGPAN